MKITIFGLHPLLMLHNKFGKDLALMMDDDKRQLIAIGHLSNSGDLKIYMESPLLLFFIY